MAAEGCTGAFEAPRRVLRRPGEDGVVRRETAWTRPWGRSGTVGRCDAIVPALPRTRGAREAETPALPGCWASLSFLPGKQGRWFVSTCANRGPGRAGRSRRSPPHTEKRDRGTLILQLGRHAVLLLLTSFQRLCVENRRRRPCPSQNTDFAPSFLRAVPHAFRGPLPGSIWGGGEQGRGRVSSSGNRHERCC